MNYPPPYEKEPPPYGPYKDHQFSKAKEKIRSLYIDISCSSLRPEDKIHLLNQIKYIVSKYEL